MTKRASYINEKYGLDRNKNRKGGMTFLQQCHVMSQRPKKNILQRLWDWFTYCPPATCSVCHTKKRLTLSLVGDMHICHLCHQHRKHYADKGLLLG